MLSLNTTRMHTSHRRTIFLARHCETAWNQAGRWQGQTDVPLNARGREQAAALAQRLRNRSIVSIRASDLSRARETADIVARVLGIAEVVVDPDLRERCFGIFEGLTREDCATRYPDFWALYEQDRGLVPPGGEQHESVLTRMRAALERAVAAGGLEAEGGRQIEGAVLVVGHGASLRVLLSMVTGRTVPPIMNGGLFRAMFAAGRFEQVQDLSVEDRQD
jgi:broad specificity phosphatase PhoE